MAMDIDAARLLAWRAAWMGATDRDYQAAEGSMSKLKASEMATRVTEKAVQILGGHGYLADHSVEEWYRNAKVFDIYEGTSQIQRMVIARSLPEAESPLPLRRGHGRVLFAAGAEEVFTGRNRHPVVRDVSELASRPPSAEALVGVAVRPCPHERRRASLREGLPGRSRAVRGLSYRRGEMEGPCSRDREKGRRWLLTRFLNAAGHGPWPGSPARLSRSSWNLRWRSPA